MADKEVEKVPGPDQDEANQTDGNQRDEDGNLVTPPAPSGDPGDADAGTAGDVAPADTDPSVNPTTPPPAEQP
jgi:hypothetical protein